VHSGTVPANTVAFIPILKIYAVLRVTVKLTMLTTLFYLPEVSSNFGDLILAQGITLDLVE